MTSSTHDTDPKFWCSLTPKELEKAKQNLDKNAFHVTQEDGTERPFDNAYWNHKEEGIYVDIVSGEPLFSSYDKFDSGTGWPSFTKPIEKNSISEHKDYSLIMPRTEVRSSISDSHLGHVFSDGPGPTGLRYCINSAALKFIPISQLKQQGYGQYNILFEETQSTNNIETAILAGGCFWGMEELFRNIPGVISTDVGYTGGTIPNPDYSIVKTGQSNHAESLLIEFNASLISYSEILKFFFKIHDPTTLNQQGNDKGTQYRSAIFYANQSQKETAETIMTLAEQSGNFKHPIVTQLIEATPFYIAEDFHQDYLQKHPNGYTCHYIRNNVNF